MSFAHSHIGCLNTYYDDCCEAHWKNLSSLILILEKAEKDGNKKYEQMQMLKKLSDDGEKVKNRLMNELEDPHILC